MVGILLLLLDRAVPVPRPLAAVVQAVAAASLWIYLTQWQVYPGLEAEDHPYVAVLAASRRRDPRPAGLRPAQPQSARPMASPTQPAYRWDVHPRSRTITACSWGLSSPNATSPTRRAVTPGASGRRLRSWLTRSAAAFDRSAS